MVGHRQAQPARAHPHAGDWLSGSPLLRAGRMTRVGASQVRQRQTRQRSGQNNLPATRCQEVDMKVSFINSCTRRRLPASPSRRQ